MLKEAMKVGVAVAATLLFLWAIGVWGWTIAAVHRWPWLEFGFSASFPVLLFVGLLVARRWSRSRQTFPLGIAAGALVGLGAAILAILTAHLLGAAQQAALLSSIRTPVGPSGLLLMWTAVATFRLVGWVYGTLAWVTLACLDVLERRVLRNRN